LGSAEAALAGEACWKVEGVNREEIGSDSTKGQGNDDEVRVVGEKVPVLVLVVPGVHKPAEKEERELLSVAVSASAGRRTWPRSAVLHVKARGATLSVMDCAAEDFVGGGVRPGTIVRFVRNDQMI